MKLLFLAMLALIICSPAAWARPDMESMYGQGLEAYSGYSPRQLVAKAGQPDKARVEQGQFYVLVYRQGSCTYHFSFMAEKNKLSAMHKACD
jgi:hypothetical protein